MTTVDEDRMVGPDEPRWANWRRAQWKKIDPTHSLPCGDGKVER